MVGEMKMTDKSYGRKELIRVAVNEWLVWKICPEEGQDCSGQNSAVADTNLDQFCQRCNLFYDFATATEILEYVIGANSRCQC